MKIVRYPGFDGAVFGALEPDGSVRAIEGNVFGEYQVGSRVTTPARFLAPVVPANILGIGLNYRKHAQEGGKPVPQRPMWFMKTNGAVQDPERPIVLPRSVAGRSDKVDFEGELAVVIGKTCRNVAKEKALDYVLGYTIANDVSARDWQFEWGGGQFCHGKSYDTFCPLGPMLVTRDELPDPQALRVITRVNGQVMQEGDTSDMVFDVATLISFLSASRTLAAGTVILTGTPHGVGYARNPPVWLTPGDVVSVEIQPIGILENPIEAEAME